MAKRTVKPKGIKAFMASASNVIREVRQLARKPQKWVLFFDPDNVYVNDLALRYRRTATMSAIINSKVNYAVGKDFTYMVGGERVEWDNLDQRFRDWAMEVNEQQTLRDAYMDAQMNWILTGNLYTHINAATAGDATAVQFRIEDSTKVRVAKDRESVYVSSFWRDIKANPSPPKEFPVKDFPLGGETGEFFWHTMRKVPEFDFYGLPDYIATLEDADIEYKVDTLNLDKINNGLRPSALITEYGEPPEGKSPQQYIRERVNSFTGEGNNYKILWSLVDSPDSAPDVQTIDNASEGEFLQLEESAYNGMIRGHRWFPELAGIETAQGLGGNQIIINKWRIAMNQLVGPEYQQPVNRVFNRIIKLAGFDVEIGIMNAPPVGIDDKIKPEGVLFINEAREALGYAPDEELEGQLIKNGSNNRDTDRSGDSS